MKHTRLPYLSGNQLKLIAALSMLLDHIGVILLPEVTVLRILGRLAFPIFAFMIAEGCRYTKNKLRYFLGVFGVGVLCQIGLWLYDPKAKLNVLLTFSVSILLIYALQYARRGLQSKRALPLLPLLAVFGGALLLTHFVRVEYGICGCLLPLFPAVIHPVERRGGDRFENVIAPVTLLSVGTFMLCLALWGLQWWSLFSLPLLFLYSGKRGRRGGKLFFYLFYPLHILILEGLALLFG